MSNLEALHRRAKALNLHGLLAHWGEAAAAGWLATLIDWEEQERTRRSLERRLGTRIRASNGPRMASTVADFLLACRGGGRGVRPATAILRDRSVGWDGLGEAMPISGVSTRP